MSASHPTRFAFTEQRLQRLPTPPRACKVVDGAERWADARVYYYDTRTPGLAVCKTSAGSSTYYVYRKMAGRPVRIRLDNVAALSVSDARELAAEVNSKLARGEDPREEKRKARSAITLSELFTYYMENHAKVHKRSWQQDQAQWDRYVTQTWGSRRIDTIHGDDVKALHKRIGAEHGHHAANRLRSLLHTMFHLAQQDLGAKGPNPVAAVKRFKEQSRERFLQGDELGKFLAAVAEIRNDSPTTADFLEVCLWTGARRGNVLSMRWAELDLDSATWTVPAEKAKADDPLHIHLPEQALAILRRRQKAAGKASGEWVFPGRRHGKHLSDPTKPWRKVLKAANLENLRIHDLRRTLGSWAAGTGASLPVIGKALGHRHTATTAIYARLNLDPVRIAVDIAAAAMQTAADAMPGAAAS